MKDELKLLIELQEMDKLILREKHIINSMPSKLRSSENQFKEIQAAYDKQKQKSEQLEKKKKEKEKEIDEVNDRVNKLKGRTTDIKTNKEYQAHLKEIEAIEKGRFKIEDDILAVMEEIEAEAKKLKAEETKMKAEKEKLDAFKKEVEAEISEAERQLNEVKAKRSALAKSIDADFYKDYMTILAANNGSAVAEAKNEICQGCHMNIPPQLFVEIRKNEDIIQCPQCRRILYWKEQTE